MPGQLVLDVDLRHYCGACPLEVVCGGRDLLPCQPRFGDPGYGGPNVLHPARPDLGDYLDEVGGGDLGDVEVRPQELPVPPVLTPRVRARRALRGQLDRDFYAVGPDQVVVGRRSVLAADDLREMLDLRPDQRLALTLFGADPTMEILWAGRRRIITEIAEAGYDLVAPPSFSARINHPPAEFVYNLKRSLVYFSMLQWAGVPAVPRLAWLCEGDVDRVATWCAAQTHLQMVALDLAVKQREEWVRQVALLRRFDLVTGGRLRFLIHGPAVGHRIEELSGILGGRVHLTGSGAIARPYACAGRFGSYVDEEEWIIEESRAALGLQPAPALRRIDSATHGLQMDAGERLAA
jgi:hypothetical protein